MADAVSTQILLDGQRKTVIKFTNISDGTGESAVNKVDISTLAGAPTKVTIEKMAYSTSGMAVRILWDATTDTVAWLIPENMDGTQDFTAYGGIHSDAGTGSTGDILFTTVNHTAGDTYSIILELRKD